MWAAVAALAAALVLYAALLAGHTARARSRSRLQRRHVRKFAGGGGWHARRSVTSELHAAPDSTGGGDSYADTPQGVRAVVQGLTFVINAAADLSQGPVDAVVPRARAFERITPSMVLEGLREDFVDKEYLWTGDINPELYDEGCVFTDPTLTFTGLKTFERNIQNLEPILDRLIPAGRRRVQLKSIALVDDDKAVHAEWRMLGRLQLPWQPSLVLDGRTTYTLAPHDKGGRIVSYDEKWDITAADALLQLTRPGLDITSFSESEPPHASNTSSPLPSTTQQQAAAPDSQQPAPDQTEPSLQGTSDITFTSVSSPPALRIGATAPDHTDTSDLHSNIQPPHTESGAARFEPPSSPNQLIGMAAMLLELKPTPLHVSILTDAINQAHPDTHDLLASTAHFLWRTRRYQLLVDLLRTDRAAYIETVSFLDIAREDMPNLERVPLGSRPQAAVPAATGGKDRESELVSDCALPDVPMGENFAEALLLRVTRKIYAGFTGGRVCDTPGIRGLLQEMREYMLSLDGCAPKSQQDAIVKTLIVLMTPVLPPFYRLFMGGLVPSPARGDPVWLVDAVQRFVSWLPAGLRANFAPGAQPLNGPLPYAPLLTSVVAPYAFGFLVGPAVVNRRADGELGGLVVKKCKFLQESNCKGMCLNSCKRPAEQLFDDLGVPLHVVPNFETQECQWSYGVEPPPPEEDPDWPQGCIVGCTSRDAMRALQADMSTRAPPTPCA